MLHRFEGIQLSNKKERITETQNNMAEPEKNPE